MRKGKIHEFDATHYEQLDIYYALSRRQPDAIRKNLELVTTGEPAIFLSTARY